VFAEIRPAVFSGLEYVSGRPRLSTAIRDIGRRFGKDQGLAASFLVRDGAMDAICRNGASVEGEFKMPDQTVLDTRPTDKPAPSTGVRPGYLSHVVLHTRDVQKMSDWWCKVLSAKSMYDTSPGAAGDSGDAKTKFDFVSFDEEHHRMAFVNADLISGRGPTAGPAAGTPTSLHHIAFTYPSLGDLVRNWQYLKSVGIMPTYTVHHGPTISNYYHDPDGNGVELQIDVFDTRKELDDWFESGAFAKHHGAGPSFDFADLAERYDAGDDDAWLRSNEGFVKKYGDPTRGGTITPKA
jgi:catechol 2,3-dioxygenase-like lactoylglutathione lyase family enzyme